MSVLSRLGDAARRDPRRVDRIALAAIALAALAIAWAFAVTVLRHTWLLALPLDDSYRDLACARRIARGAVGCAFGGECAAQSALASLVLAPLWALGARGHALVWASFVGSAVLYAATALGVHRAVRPLSGALAATFAALAALGIAAFAWAALAGLASALAAALVVWLIALVLVVPRGVPGDASGAAPGGPPPGRLTACLVAATLAGVEPALLAAAIAIGGAAVQLGRRAPRSALRWLVPLAPLAVWLGLTRGITGHWLPGLAAVRSHFAQPGFAVSDWPGTVVHLTLRTLYGVFWDPASPLIWPRAAAVLWLLGAVRVIAWARRERRWLAAGAVLGAPFAVMLAVAASSGLWSFQHGRAIAPALPLLAITFGCALGPVPRAVRWLRWLHTGAALAWTAGFIAAAIPVLASEARLFAQGAADTAAQVVTIGEYLHRKRPDARVVVYGAGAIAYHGDGPVFDLAGPIAGEPVGIAHQGPGAVFELLERAGPARGLTHFAIAPGRLGVTEFSDDDLYHTPLPRRFAAHRLTSDGDLPLGTASWDHAGTGERPLGDHAGWAIVDRIDIADLASEAAHGWAGTLGPRAPGDSPAHWSFVGREVGAQGLVLDGGRTILASGERFAIATSPVRPVRLVLRTGGARAYPAQELADRAVVLRILDEADRELARATLPPATGRFAEVVFALPVGTPAVLHTRAAGPYRAFHWFVLQPE